MKFLTIFILFTSQWALAQDHPEVHQQLFSAIEKTYEVNLGESPCGEGQYCSLIVLKYECLRRARCNLTVLDNSGNPHDFMVHRRDQTMLGLLLGIKRAFAIQNVQIEKFGAPYRPSFRLQEVMTCLHNKIDGTYLCQ